MTCQCGDFNLCDMTPPPRPPWMTNEEFNNATAGRKSWQYYLRHCVSDWLPPASPTPLPVQPSKGHVLWWIAPLLLLLIIAACLVLIWLKKNNKLNKIMCVDRISAKFSGKSGESSSHEVKAGVENIDVDDTDAHTSDGRYSPFPKGGATNGHAVTNAKELPNANDTQVLYTQGRGLSAHVEIKSNGEQSNKRSHRKKGRRSTTESRGEKTSPRTPTRLPPLAGVDSNPRVVHVESPKNAEDIRDNTPEDLSPTGSNSAVPILQDNIVLRRFPYKIPPISSEPQVNSSEKNRDDSKS